MNIGQNIAHYKIIQKLGKPAGRHSLLHNSETVISKESSTEKSFTNAHKRFLPPVEMTVLQQAGAEWANSLFEGEL